MRTRSTRHAGFTLIELLVVIAIIAILAGILFPVFNQVRIKVQETRCMNNMHQLSQALQLYVDNWGKYPICLDTVVSTVGNNKVMIRPLFPQYFKTEEGFHCPTAAYGTADANVNFMDPANANLLTSLQPEQAIKRWPNINGSPLQICVSQAGVPRALASQCRQNEQGFPVQFPLRDSYDGGLVPNQNSSFYEQHYNPDWTEVPPSINDLSRQLKYRNPPADSVVTWCMNHVSIDSNGLPHGNVLVLFKDGRVKNVPGEKFAPTDWGKDGSQFQVRP
jgi:prepilin-type N-terminal cleavage/methylation domain-containing protein